MEDLPKSTYSLSIEIKVHGKGYDWYGHNGHKYGNVDQGIHKIVITINYEQDDWNHQNIEKDKNYQLDDWWEGCLLTQKIQMLKD